MKVETIAQILHEANRAYCQEIGDDSQLPWEQAFEWQRNSAINGVHFRLKNPNATPASMHQNWLDEKLKEGWRYGKVKDVEKKEHPCMLAYGDLPEEQKFKDKLFFRLFDVLTNDGEDD